ncbi:MAG TPA: PQQ-binding-like beta-propeller repeat protein [Pirellulales bacterium]|jgi:outer membrane protein assembly factor BamB|nr:PQQ-binding-like beta-propeller repeat protein [Pirellulales bacterium]
MSSISASTGQGFVPPSTSAADNTAVRKLRLWPAVVLVAVLWASYVGADYVEMSMFIRFASRWGMYAVVLLCFIVWWMFFSRARWSDRFLGLAVFIGGSIIAGLFADRSTTAGMALPGFFMAGFPVVLTVWAIWLLMATRWIKLSPRAQRIGLCAGILLGWGYFDLVRWEGLDGGQHSAFAWRWQPTSEQKFLVQHASATSGSAEPGLALHLRPDDWPEFRGPERNNQVHGLKLATDWQQQPPKQLWRQRVGPAWSSMIVVDGLLFTLEQRGDQEATVCYDVATGKERWAHTVDTRFFESLSGAGPRGTPTFADGRIYSLGATGKLNCLDAASGKPIWSHDIVADAQAEAAPAPFTARQWGYSNSPLVVNGLVIVFAGGQRDKSLLAYRADTGKPAWTYAAGKDGYSSPQLISLGGQSQLLMHSTGGLVALDPSTGKMLWQRPSANPMFLPITQPQAVGGEQLLTQSENGVQLIKLTSDGDRWSPAQRWDSKALKLTLNDYVVYDGCVYGFDDNVFCCLDLETGKRRWKGGRYGSGQVLLLPDQPLLVVTSETGEAILVAPNREKLEELGRFQAVEGKTWNHPVIAEGKLFVRNAEEMACYELPLAQVQ